MDITVAVLAPDGNGKCRIAGIQLYVGQLSKNLTRNYNYIHVTGIPNKYGSNKETRVKFMSGLQEGYEGMTVKEDRAKFVYASLPAQAQADLLDNAKHRQCTVTALQALAALEMLEVDPDDPDNQASWTTRGIVDGDW